MALLANILVKEDERKATIHLYREGLFLVAYEWSAYLFHRHIREYKVRRKYYKAARRNVCSLGFPAKAFEGLMAGKTLSAFEMPEGYFIKIDETDPCEGGLFEAWSEAVELAPAKETPAPALVSPLPEPPPRVDTTCMRIAEKIRNFDLLNETPLKCAMFIAELKKELHSNS